MWAAVVRIAKPDFMSRTKEKLCHTEQQHLAVSGTSSTTTAAAATAAAMAAMAVASTMEAIEITYGDIFWRYSSWYLCTDIQSTFTTRRGVKIRTTMFWLPFYSAKGDTINDRKTHFDRHNVDYICVTYRWWLCVCMCSRCAYVYRRIGVVYLVL